MDNKETFTQIGESIKENSNSVPNLSHRQEGSRRRKKTRMRKRQSMVTMRLPERIPRTMECATGWGFIIMG